jgi:DNA-binding beta-propeller fold protein YncE
MIKVNHSCFAAVCAVLSLLGSLPVAKADIPGTTLVDNVDLLPGPDVFLPRQFALNPNTHKLYVAGGPLEGRYNPALRIVNTISSQDAGVVDLGRYAGSPNGFNVLGLAVDESATPVGNKIYVVGRSNTSAAFLRVIDGVTDTNLTGEGTDVLLPIFEASPTNEYCDMVVNSANHKVYVLKMSGDIVVVDGPNRQVLMIIPRHGGPNAPGSLVANSPANKIFLFRNTAAGVIDSATDTFTSLLLPFYANGAVANSAGDRIYIAGAQGSDHGIYVIDGNTGQLITTRTVLPDQGRSVAFDPTDDTLYVGTWSSIEAISATDLSTRGTLGHNASRLTCDPAAANRLLTLPDYRFQPADDLQNAVGALNPATGDFHAIALGYRPFDVAVNSRTNRIYVSDEQTNELLALDGTSHAVISRVPVPYSYTKPHIAVSERLNLIYLSRTALDPPHDDPHPRIDVYDGGTNRLLRSISDGNGDLVAVDDARRRIYIPFTRFVGGDESLMKVQVYDADTDALITSINLGLSFQGYIDALAVNPVTGRVYVSTNGGVAIVDGNTNTKIAAVSSVHGPIAINRKTNKVYVANTDYNRVNVINGGTNTLETSFPNTSQNNDDTVDALAVDEVTNRVYVLDAAHVFPTHTGRVTAFDANNVYQFLGQVDLGLKPVGIAFAPTTRQLFVSNDLDANVSVLQAEESAPADLFGNISTRAYISAADNVLIGGFILGGSSPETKRVLIRAIGPSLTQLGVAGALPDTTLEVHASGNVTTNDNWKINDASGLSQQAEIEASGLPPGHDLESALVMTLPAGQSATAIVRGRNGAPGIGLVEVFDLDHGSPAKLLNISTRGQVGIGDNVIIAGTIILGSKSTQVVLRAIGPSLAGAGVPNPLEDPVLELRDPNGELIAVNDDWREHEAEVNATMLPPTDPRESVIVATLYPANYTAIARGKNDSTGVALVEAYYLSQ